jgi:hypothetical protein
MKWGLVIQGPTITFGQGPNNSEFGFSAESTIKKNILRFSSLIDEIVISTWENSEIEIKDFNTSKIKLIENVVPIDCDFDNRRKQFITTLAGCRYLLGNSKVTHVLKIRTDQEVDNKLMDWLITFFSKTNKDYRESASIQEDYLVFSDMLVENPFYLGDFIFAGTIKDVTSFCEANLKFYSRNLHPLIGIDYVLKYLSQRDKLFWINFFKVIPLIFQVSNKNNFKVQAYWRNIMATSMTVIPHEFFDTIIWRGKPMSDVIPDSKSKFQFYEDWIKVKYGTVNISNNNFFSRLIPTKYSFLYARNEYITYYKKMLKYYLRKIV